MNCCDDKFLQNIEISTKTNEKKIAWLGLGRVCAGLAGLAGLGLGWAWAVLAGTGLRRPGLTWTELGWLC